MQDHFQDFHFASNRVYLY